MIHLYEKLKYTDKHTIFSSKCLRAMNQNSKISMRIIFEQLKQAKNLSLDEILVQDYRLTDRIV